MSTQTEVDEQDWERDSRGFRVVPDVDDAFIHAASDPMSDFVDIWCPEKPIDRQRWMTALRKAVNAMQEDAAGATVVRMTEETLKELTLTLRNIRPEKPMTRSLYLQTLATGFVLGWAILHLLMVLFGQV